MCSKHFSHFLKVFKMATLKVEHKTFDEKTACYKMDLSIIFVVYDTLKKSQLLLKNCIGFEYEVADLLRHHAVCILCWNVI